MKALKLMVSAFMASCMAVAFTACSDDDPVVTPPVTPEEPEQPVTPEEPEPTPTATYHFDLFVCAVKHGGMSQNKNGTFVRSVSALTSDQPMVDFTGKGLDITQDYTMESIVKGKYYYQVPQSPADRFVKFQIVKDADGDEVAQKIAEVPFLGNTYFARKYTHAWLDDATLVVVGTDSDHKIVYWSKLNDGGDKLSIAAEGTLDIPMPEGASALSTSGILTYRQTDGKLFYFYNGKIAAGLTESATSTFHVAVIDPVSMQVQEIHDVDPALAEECAASAYGELMQNTVMYDESGNLYMACLKTINGDETGVLLRMDVDKTTFDTAYNGFPNPEGKLLTIQYLANGKALAYSRDNSKGVKIDSVSHFYTIIDLATGERKRVSCSGVDLPYCGGRFSQRSVVVGDKAYIGCTEGEGETDNPRIYIYDIPTGEVTMGLQLSKGFCFDILRVVED